MKAHGNLNSSTDYWLNYYIYSVSLENYNKICELLVQSNSFVNFSICFYKKLHFVINKFYLSDCDYLILFDI